MITSPYYVTLSFNVLYKLYINPQNSVFGTVANGMGILDLLQISVPICVEFVSVTTATPPEAVTVPRKVRLNEHNLDFFLG